RARARQAVQIPPNPVYARFAMETDTAPLRLARSGIRAGRSHRPDPVNPLLGSAGVDSRHALEHLNAVRLLSLDAHGRVINWINWQQAACLYARDAVAWTLGDPCLA